MVIDDDLRNKIGVALNEATMLGVEFDEEKNLISCSFAVVAMDKDGDVPADNRLLFVFKPIGRFVASFRNGLWNDKDATVNKIQPTDILKVVQSFQGQAIYGWDFVNCGDNDFDTWKDRLSFDYSTGTNIGLTNTIDLFQEDGEKHLDFRIWFDDLEIFTPKFDKVELQTFLDNGKRGWDAVYENNKKMNDFGIIPATKELKDKVKDTIVRLTGEPQTKSWWTKIKDRYENRNDRKNKP
jgi:hypothetical protein